MAFPFITEHNKKKKTILNFIYYFCGIAIGNIVQQNENLNNQNKKKLKKETYS